MTDRDVAVTSEHPVASLKHIARGIARRGLKPVPPKASISLRVDADVLEWLKAQGLAIKPASMRFFVPLKKRWPNHAVNTDAYRRRCAPWWSPVTLVR
jgi:hypothetical protein